MGLFKKKKEVDLVALAKTLTDEHQKMSNGLNFLISYGNYYERRRYHLTEGDAATELTHVKDALLGMAARYHVLQAVIEKHSIDKECEQVHYNAIQQVRENANIHTKQRLEAQKKAIQEAQVKAEAKKEVEQVVKEVFEEKQEEKQKSAVDEKTGQIIRVP